MTPPPPLPGEWEGTMLFLNGGQSYLPSIGLVNWLFLVQSLLKTVNLNTVNLTLGAVVAVVAGGGKTSNTNRGWIVQRTRELEVHTWQS